MTSTVDTQRAHGGAHPGPGALILCQPDSRKGCSACCGLFNFMDISREHLSRFLEEGDTRSCACLSAADSSDEGDRSAIRDFTSYICPHQGLLSGRKPGCLLHPAYRATTLRNESFFGETICNGFLCPAHKLLSAEHKKIIMDRLDDWYTYSIAVIDPLFTSWLLYLLGERLSAATGPDESLPGILHECLMIHARHLSARPGPLFFYSTAEYSAARNKAALAGGGAANGEKDEIEEAIRTRF
jgi:hypothetical protein